MVKKERKIEGERIYTIHLRKEFSKAPNYKRTKKSVIALREFIQKHMKVEKVKIGKNLNLKLWSRGRKNPFPRIKVKTKIEDDYALVELPEFDFQKKKEEKKEKSVKEKVQEKLGIKSKEETKEEKAKKEEKMKELEKELERKQEQQTKTIAAKQAPTKEQQKMSREKYMVAGSDKR